MTEHRVYAVAPEVREEVLLRDGDRCRFCRVMTLPGDHRSALGRRFARVQLDGPMEADNLVTACVVCAQSRARMFVEGELSTEQFATRWAPRQILLPLTFRSSTATWLADRGVDLPTDAQVRRPLGAVVESSAPAACDASRPTAAEPDASRPPAVATRRAAPAETPVWQPITRELLATLRAGDVVELRTPVGPDGPAEPALTIRATLTPALLLSGTPQPNSLALGDPSWGPQLSNDGQPVSWMQMLELAVVHQPPRLYENSTRTEPAVGDTVRDRDGDVYLVVGPDQWYPAAPGVPPVGHTQDYVRSFGPLTLLWDGATGRRAVSP